MTDDVRLRTQSLGPMFLTFNPDDVTVQEKRVVAQLHGDGDPDPQTWKRTSRGNGRHTFHQVIDGSELYLTAEAATNRARVVMAAKRDGFDKQTWRDNPIGHLELGTSQRWLQADDTIDCGQRFVVEVVTQDSLTQGSEWEQLLA
jgi:hypothetical protein